MFSGSFETEFGALELSIRLVVAAAFGGIIGYEREHRRRPAGLRTHMLISLAAASFTLLTAELIYEASEAPSLITIDPSRLIDAVIAGVAFLGAGTIIQSRGDVRGITTGASMWLAGGIGLAVGGGFYILAFATTMVGLVILLAVGYVEDRYVETGDDGADKD